MSAAVTGDRAAAPISERLIEPPHAASFDRRGDALPPSLRPQAALGVLDVTKWFGATSGGVRTYLLQKAAYVERHPELRQVIVVPGADDLMGDGDGVRCYQLRSPRIPRYPPYRLLHDRRTIVRIARQERPQIIEAGSPVLVPWLARAAARELGVPLVAYHHGLFPHNIAPFPPQANRLARAGMHVAWRYLRLIDRYFALTLVGSDFAASELRAHGIDRTARVPLGVDLQLFHPRRRACRTGVRARIGVHDRPLVTFVGRFSVEKGLDVLFDAWSQVARRTGAALLLVGDGPLSAWVSARAAALGGQVQVQPFERDRDRLADLLAASDVTICPGPSETFGLVALESFASGTPVLSPDRGGVAEQLGRSGAGSTYRVGDAESLAEALVQLLYDDRRVLGERGRAYAEREHAWDIVFDRLVEIYRTVIREWH